MFIENAKVFDYSFDIHMSDDLFGRIFIYNNNILLPLIFDEQTNKKRYSSTGNQTHDQD